MLTLEYFWFYRMKKLNSNSKFRIKLWDLYLSSCSGYGIVSNLQNWVKNLEKQHEEI